MNNESNCTLAALRKIIKGHNNRSLKELYKQNDEIDQVSNFTLIVNELVNFEETVKEEVWIKAMDE